MISDQSSIFSIFRFENLDLHEGNLILYVGGNTDGADGIQLMNHCPKWYTNTCKILLKFLLINVKIIFFSKMHIFEPVPEFSHKLSEAWRINIIQNNWDVTIHEYGLGAFTR